MIVSENHENRFCEASSGQGGLEGGEKKGEAHPADLTDTENLGDQATTKEMGSDPC